MKINKLFKAGIRYVLDKNYRFVINAGYGKYDNMDDKEFLIKKFQACMGRELNIQNPKTYNEKLQWLKLYNRRPEYVDMVDKLKVREYVKNVLGEEYLIPLIGVWNNQDEIDFNKLPNQFVIKCNHNSGTGMYICTDKSKMNVSSVKEGLKKGLSQNYYLKGREWTYKDVSRKIIAEKFMVDDVDKELKDYKFYCFNGKVEIIMINSDRNSENPTKADYFDRSFNWLDFIWGYEHASTKPEKPENFELMVNIAEKLSEGIPHVRVDLYNCNGKIYFGELTFFDGSGFDKIEPIEWDYKLGNLIDITAINNE